MNDGISHLTKPKISACQTNGYRVLPWLNMQRMCILELWMLVRNIVLKPYCMVRLLQLSHSAGETIFRGGERI